MFDWWTWWPRKRRRFTIGECPSNRTATFILYNHTYKIGDVFNTKDIHGKVEHVDGNHIRVRIWEHK